MVERKAFIAKLKHQYCVSQRGKHDCSAKSQNELGLLQESKFVSFLKRTLIMRKKLERKAFFPNPKSQYRVSQ